MHYVYHHLSQPREMLIGLWKSLKPGGYLVVVDRHRGTLQDWVPRGVRSKKHHWLAETTVVREAREQGFAYAGCAEECWPADDHFVLVFQRPQDATASASGSDPDQPLPLDLEKAKRHLLSPQSSLKRPVIVALGQARELIGPIVQHASGAGVDVILEEWATQKDERPELPAGVSLPSVMTDRGAVLLDNEMIDAVFFLDTYHRLFHHEKTLEALREKLAPNSRLYVLDRIAESELSRRESSHQRRISVELVIREMKAAGFRLQSQEPAPAADRMLLVFER
jgi:predicted methyltransferase